MKFINDTLKANPKLLSKYVTFVTTIVDTALVTSNKMMRHLLVVKGINVDTQAQSFKRSPLNSVFDRVSSHDYDNDVTYKPSWAYKSFKQAKESLKDLDLTMDNFNELTDIYNLNDNVNIVDVKTSSLKDALTIIKAYANDLGVNKKPNKGGLFRRVDE